VPAKQYIETAALFTLGFGTVGPVNQFERAFAILAEGSGNNNRVGSQISMQRIVWRAHIIVPPAAADVYHVRALLVKYNFDTGSSIPGLENVLRFVSTGTEASVSLYQKQTTPNSQPFRILMDRTIPFSYDGTSPSKNLIFTYRFRKPNVVTYSGSLAILDNISKGIIVLYVFSSAIVNYPIMNYSMRMYYTDV